MKPEIAALIEKEKEFNQIFKKSFDPPIGYCAEEPGSYEIDYWNLYIKTKYKDNICKYEEYTEEIFLIFEKTIDKIIEEYNRKTFIIIKEKFGVIKAAFNEIDKNSSIFDSDMDWRAHICSLVLMLSSHYLNMLEIIRIEEFMKKVDLSRNESLAVACYLVDKGHIKLFMNLSQSKNTLLATQLINRFSAANSIRFEDSITVFCEYLCSKLVIIGAIARMVCATKFTNQIDAILRTDIIYHIL